MLPTGLYDTTMAKTVRFRNFLFVVVVLVAFVQLREISGDLRVTYQKHFTDPETVRQYFAANAIRKLQLGAGRSNPDGWINSDIKPIGNSIYLDARQKYNESSPNEDSRLNHSWLLDKIGPKNVDIPKYKSLSNGYKFNFDH